MADYLFQDHSSPLQPKPTSRNNRGKFFCSNFFFRLLLFALFPCVIPLFTSEAPDFISHTVFAKSWELVHLFIIGILVSYGLFGRRKPQTLMGIQTPPAFNSPNMLHASTIFNFEHQNPCGYSVYGNGFGNDNVNQAWDFRPYGLEPTVVVRPGTRDFDYEPLDLPVRSLRSRVEESDSEEFASESEIEADASSNCCCSEEDNESENLEENNLVGSSSPTPWNWPNSTQNCYLSSPCEAKRTSYENLEPSLSPQSSPLCSSSTELPSMDVEVDSSWNGPTREENVLNSQPLMADPKEEASDVCFVREFHEVKHVKTRSFRVSSSEGSSPFSPSLSESPPMEAENSRMENVDTKLRTSPTSSLKSRSMRVDFKEKVGDVSLHFDTQCQNLPHSQVSSSGFSPLCSVASRSPTRETENLLRDSKRQHLQSFSSRSPKSVSPMCNFISPSAVSESPPTIEMEDLQTETEKVDNLLNEMSEGHTFSPFVQDGDFPLKRVGSRSRRSRKRDDIKGEMKSRTDSLRSESSCDTTSSPSPSTSSHHFTSTIELKQSSEIGPSKEVEINASKNDIVLPTEPSRIQLGPDSSLNKDEKKTLSRTSHSRRFSIGSFFDRDRSKEITKKVKDENGSNNSGKCGWDCLKLDVKPILTKNSLRGKSVRTVRPQAITLEPSCTNEISSKQKTDERVRERQDVVIISIGISEKNNGRNQKGTTTKNERGDSSSLELDKNKERSSVVEDANEDEDCSSEIDRKADEFIAKFKEQIRLQKVASRRVSSKH